MLLACGGAYSGHATFFTPSCSMLARLHNPERYGGEDGADPEDSPEDFPDDGGAGDAAGGPGGKFLVMKR